MLFGGLLRSLGLPFVSVAPAVVLAQADLLACRGPETAKEGSHPLRPPPPSGWVPAAGHLPPERRAPPRVGAVFRFPLGDRR